MNPDVFQSVRVTARHHALVGCVVRVVRRKLHRGEAHLVVEVDDGSRQLIAVRNTEFADARSPTPDLRFTPGSLRALVDIIKDHRGRLEDAGGTAEPSPDEPAGVEFTSSSDARSGGEALDRAAEAPTTAPGTGRAVAARHR